MRDAVAARPTVGYLLASPAGGIREAVAVVERATEQQRTVHLPEHAGQPGYFRSALASASYFLGAVPGARVRTAGVVAGARDPLSVVRDAGALAEAAVAGGGWFGLGAVAGWDPVDLPGERFARRFRALDELCDAAADRRWELLMGGGGPESLRRASRADGLLAGTHHELDALVDLVERFRGIGGSRRVVAIRRWIPDGGDAARARTPDASVVRGAAARDVCAGLAGIVDEVVFGPVDGAPSLAVLEACLDG